MRMAQAAPTQPLHVTETVTSRVIEILRAQAIGVRFSSKDIADILGRKHLNAISASLHSKRNLGMYKVVGESYKVDGQRYAFIVYEMLDPTVKMRLYCTRVDDVRPRPRPKGYTRTRESRPVLGPDWRDCDAAPSLADDSPPQARTPVARASAAPAPDAVAPPKTLSDQILELAVSVETLENRLRDLTRVPSEDLVSEMNRRGFRWVGLCAPVSDEAK